MLIIWRFSSLGTMLGWPGSDDRANSLIVVLDQSIPHVIDLPTKRCWLASSATSCFLCMYCLAASPVEENVCQTLVRHMLFATFQQLQHCFSQEFLSLVTRKGISYLNVWQQQMLSGDHFLKDHTCLTTICIQKAFVLVSLGFGHKISNHFIAVLQGNYIRQ